MKKAVNEYGIGRAGASYQDIQLKKKSVSGFSINVLSIFSCCYLFTLFLFSFLFCYFLFFSFLLFSLLPRLWTSYMIGIKNGDRTPEKFEIGTKKYLKEAANCESVHNPLYCAFMCGPEPHYCLGNVSHSIIMTFLNLFIFIKQVINM